MQASQIDREYSYQDSEARHHHAYLLNPLLNLLSEKANTINTNTERLRILDIGCGNGSLTKRKRVINNGNKLRYIAFIEKLCCTQLRH